MPYHARGDQIFEKVVSELRRLNSGSVTTGDDQITKVEGQVPRMAVSIEQAGLGKTTTATVGGLSPTTSQELFSLGLPYLQNCASQHPEFVVLTLEGVLSGVYRWGNG